MVEIPEEKHFKEIPDDTYDHYHNIVKEESKNRKKLKPLLGK